MEPEQTTPKKKNKKGCNISKRLERAKKRSKEALEELVKLETELKANGNH